MNKQLIDYQFTDIILILIKKKLFISLLTIAFLFFGTLYAFSVNEVYQSSARFISKEENNNVTSALGSLPGIAALGNFGANTNNKNTIIAEELITSKQFIINLLIENNLLNHFYAVDSWDKKNNKIIFDNDLLLDKKYFLDNINEINTRIIVDDIFNTYLDFTDLKKNKNGVYTLTFNYYSPYFAKEFLDILLSSINETIRADDLINSQLAIDFLTEQLQESSNTFVKESVGRLIEAYLSSKMKAVVSIDGYVFDLLEKPSLNGKKVYPSKKNIMFLSLITGFIFSITLTLLSVFYQEIKNKK